MTIEGVKYKLWLGQDSTGYYCQFERQDCNNFQGSELQNELHSILPHSNNNLQFAIWKYENDYFDVLIVLEKVLEIIHPKIDKGK